MRMQHTSLSACIWPAWLCSIYLGQPATNHPQGKRAHECAMAESTNKTPLLGTSTQYRSGCCILPYVLLLVVCFSCNLVPLVPSQVFESTFPGNAETLQICVLVVPDYIQDMLWPPLGQVLDHAAFDALHDRMALERRHIRKSTPLTLCRKGWS